jgi:hypothetical protein
MNPRSTTAQATTPDTQRSLEQLLRFEFRRFLAHGFDNNVALVAYTFGVTPETARLWITTERLPRAEMLYRMQLGYPAFAARLRLIVDNARPGSAPPRPSRKVA